MRGPATAGNSKLFKDFCNEAEMEKNNQIVGFILTSSLREDVPQYLWSIPIPVFLLLI